MSASAATTGGEVAVTAEEAAAAALKKRYEGLVTVRNKAVKGKGAWYWAHLQPLLVHSSDTGLPKAVKLKCCLCDTVFSASNPSRTASEHLKRGTCPNFASPPQPTPVAVGEAVTQEYNHRKRSSSSSSTGGGTPGVGGSGGPSPSPSTTTNSEVARSTPVTTVSYAPPVSVVRPNPLSSELGLTVVHHPEFQHLTSPTTTTIVAVGRDGSSEDVKMFEDSIKRLKSPKPLVGPTLSRSQIERGLHYLSDWVYESCGSISFSSLEHPKFKAFLQQMGMVEISKRELLGSRLDSRFEEVRNESNARIRESMFFQIGSHGWKSNSGGFEENLVSVTANLPNGTSVYTRAVFNSGKASGKLAEEVLWGAISEICGNSVHRCVGIVADRFKNSVLNSLEGRYQWMINLSCQCQAFDSLIKDFYKELPLFKNVVGSCRKLANFVNNNGTLRNCFHKYQLRVFRNVFEISSFEPVYGMIEDIMSSARELELVLVDESYKIACMEDPAVREFGDMIRDVGFWNDLDAVRSLVKLVKEMAREFEMERPLVGQCLPLWDELRTKVKEWCSKFHIAEIMVDKVIERRFRKNYHPAWAAAYILDPFYMIRDPAGNYLPPFKYLSPEQQKDVHDLITRLVSREEVTVVMSELMRWRSDGLDPVYAQAVQLKQRDPNTGKMKIANPHGSRLVWETYLPQFESLGKVALRIIFLHAAVRGFKCNASIMKWVQNHGRSRVALDKAQKMVFIAAHSKLERRDFTSEDDKEAELFGSVNGEDDVVNGIFVDQ
ncbi:uncharacterized protein LOC141653623 [Silene latifolia]|uniref:uncharacterized protein LOC141653623 n=1 Tax=Silene latifolia TaxID=37657 RepID=UPI003D776452